MNSVTLQSPAKINLMLSVHGKRADGFHALTSVVVPLTFGDTLRVAVNDRSEDQLTCSDTAVPTGEKNIIMRAAVAFRAETSTNVYFDFNLEKRIPMGAGLGGGSSNAAVALKAMSQLSSLPLSQDKLLHLAAELGSDCPFFIDSIAAVMTGRGEVLDAFSQHNAEQLHGQRVLLFRPNFAINTAWAYQALIAAQPSVYESHELADQRLARFHATGRVDELLFNTFENTVGNKYLAIQCLLGELRLNGIACSMSGSGSCCYALPKNSAEAATVQDICQNAWGFGIFFIETSIL